MASSPSKTVAGDQGSLSKQSCLTSSRKRKIKCDETKPSCQKCVKTGRTCDGYESLFRISTSQTINTAHTGYIKPYVASLTTQPTLFEIDPQDVDLLNRCFSIKTMFDVELGCDDEARQVLQASLTSTPLRHAVLSLRALREDIETYGDDQASAAPQTSGYNHGIHQYNMALGSLASSLSSPGSKALKSALFCCQIFISIEQLRKNTAAMIQHIIRGLQIMHEYRARPAINDKDELVPAHPGQLPYLDIFVIKMFAAPCKFADPPATPVVSQTTSSHHKAVDIHDLRTIAPDMRTEITRVAASTLKFLDKVSQVKSLANALRLTSERAALLDSLKSWATDLELVQMGTRSCDGEPISISFLRLFHLILKRILLGALDSSPGLYSEMQIESSLLQSIADNVGERLGTYKMCNGISSGSGYRSGVP